MIDCSKHLSQPTLNWIQNASPKDIAAALDIGYRSLTYALEAAKIEKITNINTKGVIGEQCVYSLLKSKYANVVNTTKTAHNGDIHVKVNNVLLLIEVKNYNNLISTAQLTKFVNDIMVVNANCGLFISLNSPIVGVNNTEIRFENHNNKIIPCAYISKYDDAIVLSIVDILIQLTSILLSLEHSCMSNDKINNFIYDIDSIVTKFSKSRVQIQGEISGIFDKLLCFSSDMATYETLFRKNVNDLRCEFESSLSLNILDSLDCVYNYTIQSPETKLAIKSIIQTITSKYNKSSDIAAWKFTIKKCEHLSTNIMIILNTNKSSLSVPRKLVAMDSLFSFIQTYKTAIQISDYVKFNIDASLESWLSTNRLLLC